MIIPATARLFRMDPNYRISVKSDPEIVIKHIKTSHYLIADEIGKRGGGNWRNVWSTP